MIRMHYAPGDVLIHEGRAAEYVYRVASGRVEVRRAVDTTDADGGSIVLGTVGPGEFLGEMGVIEDRAHLASVIALEPTEVDMLPRQEFLGLVSRSPEAALNLLTRLSARLRAMDDRVAAMYRQMRDGGYASAEGVAIGLSPAGEPTPGSAALRSTVSGAPMTEPEVEADTVVLTLLAEGDDLDPRLQAPGLTPWRFPFYVGRMLESGNDPMTEADTLHLVDAWPYRLAPTHFCLDRWGREAFVIRDLGSQYGTMVNDEPLGGAFPRDYAVLAPGEHRVVAGGAGSPFAFIVVVEPAAV